MRRVSILSSRGSILAYSLILLGIVLVASIGMMSASVTNLKSVSSNDKSVSAFQIADSASQIAIRLLNDTSSGTLKDMVEPDTSCPGGSAAAMEDGNFLGGSYRIVFLDVDGQMLKCGDDVSDVVSVKSVGTYGDTVRAVQAAAMSGSKLLGWWKFNDGSGVTAVNEASSRGNGTLGGSSLPIWGDGPPNYTLDFSGADGEVTMANESDFDLKRTISISLWFRVDNFPSGSGWAPLVSKMDSSGSDASQNYSVWINGLKFVHLTSSSSSGTQACSDTKDILNTGTWYHYVGVIDRDSGSMKRYVDGNLVLPGLTTHHCSGAGVFTSGDAQENNNPVKVGGKFGSFDSFDGKIDDVRIYNGLLSSTDVSLLYDSGNGRE
ncbi:MAG: LamG domain-containing protein [Candidatus Moraniibacteriota bacterium]|nr:MAG: LamG domain-containing protein [Candidatus Moranbacteria bacterium]